MCTQAETPEIKQNLTRYNAGWRVLHKLKYDYNISVSQNKQVIYGICSVVVWKMFNHVVFFFNYV